MEVTNVSPALRERLGLEATVSLLVLLDTARKEWVEEVTATAVDRFDARLSAEMTALRLEMHNLGVSLRQEMGDQRVELLKWAFLFWVGQAATTAAIVGGMLALQR
jgi:hypothetical protein